MSQKVLQEFGSKLLRAKNLYETTKFQCDKLKKESIELEKELQKLQQDKLTSEKLENSLKHHYLNTVKCNSKENEKYDKEKSELDNLRNLKKKLVKEKEICESDLNKNSGVLHELVTERIELENQSKSLSEKLEMVTNEKNIIYNQFIETNSNIENTNREIKEIKLEIEAMKGLLTQSVGKPYV